METKEIKVGSRVIGVRGHNVYRRMRVVEVRNNGTIFVMDNGAFLGADEFRLAD